MTTPGIKHLMLTAAIVFVISALVGSVLTPLLRNWAVRRGMLDHASNSRKIHALPVPRVGGLAIVAAFFLPLLGLLFVDTGVARLFRSEPAEVAGLFLGGLAIAALGLFDDVRNLRARWKLLVQLAVGLLMYGLGFRIDEIANPFGGANLQLGMLGLPLTVLWYAGVINAMNLIDGLDGLAGGVAFIGISSAFVVAVLRGDALMMLFGAALAGAIVGFLFYNFNPASIFMGDTGSMFLGFVLASAAIQTHHKSSAAVAMLAPVVALGLPIGDTLLAMIRRLLRGRPMFQADREHIHHLLLARGLSHRAACLSLYGVALVLGAAAVLLTVVASGWQAVLVTMPLVAAGALFLRWLGYARFERVPEVAEIRRRNLEVRAQVREAGDALRHAAEVSDIWRIVRAAAPALGAQGVALRLQQDHAGGKKLTEYTTGFDEAGSDLFRARYPIAPERKPPATLELGWTDGRSTIDRDTEIAVETLCLHLATAVERIEQPEAQVFQLRRRA